VFLLLLALHQLNLSGLQKPFQRQDLCNKITKCYYISEANNLLLIAFACTYEDFTREYLKLGVPIHGIVVSVRNAYSPTSQLQSLCKQLLLEDKYIPQRVILVCCISKMNEKKEVTVKEIFVNQAGLESTNIIFIDTDMDSNESYITLRGHILNLKSSVQNFVSGQ